MPLRPTGARLETTAYITQGSVEASHMQGVEGPADRFLAGAGYGECSATQMARIYSDVASVFVLDAVDAGEAAAIGALDVTPVMTDVLMVDRPARVRLARTAVEAVL